VSEHPRPPNILWLCADDFTPDACGAYGNVRARTPNLDRLAAGGVRFDRAYCACPLSTPSRQAFWTGRYPRSIGVTLSTTPLPDGEVTIPALLRRAGYRTAAFGKTHYYAPRPHEFDVRADLDDHEKWLAGRGAQTLPLGPKLGRWRPFFDPPQVWLNSAALPYGAANADMAGTFFASRAARYLRHPPAEPFFLFVSFYETHSPFWFPVEYRGRHDPKSFPVPPVSPADLDRLPAVFRGLTVPQKQGILAAYHTSAEFLDRNLGRVLDALDRSGRADGTLVVFTSDHGYLLGQHGRFEKHCCYEPAVRAALMMRWPGATSPGRSTEALVELIDLVPTLLEACGVPAPANLQGRSLAALLRGETDRHRDRVTVEYADNAEAMVRTDVWKLIYCSGRRRRQDGYALDHSTPARSIQLFDLSDDPDETTNLVNRSEYAEVVKELTRHLADHVIRTARHPERLPATDDPFAILDEGLLPSEEVF
jgi:choline-sulfatase